MPYALPTPCSHPGCPALSHGPRCPAHAPVERRRDYERRRARGGEAVYATARWKRARLRYLAEHPICEHCGDGLSTLVHHRVALAAGGEPYAGSNLMALCSMACHAAVEGKSYTAEGRGEGNLYNPGGRDTSAASNSHGDESPGQGDSPEGGG